MKKDKWKQNRTFLRDWRVVNERLVVRGEFLLDLDWAKDWDKELEVFCCKGNIWRENKIKNNT